MKINDRVYGNQEINEAILLDLINSNSIKRLKDISQIGMPDEYLSFSGFSRYEHSLGVMILLKRLRANLEEQVAGLLHDISHTPFSHVIDWVIGDPTKEDYQDSIFREFLEKSDSFDILKKHKLNTELISDLNNFKLLERESPKLCADRLDYSLRQIRMEKGKELANKIFGDLCVYENQIAFNSLEVARLFGKEYMNLQTLRWAGDEMRSKYYILSETLKEALNKSLIEFNQFYGTEKPILKILNNSNNELILSNLNLLKKGFSVIEDENGIELKKKFRYVDPEIRMNGGIVCLSDICEDYKKLINYEKEKNLEVKKIKIIPN
ncbi:MAG TPA: HD domain-containing protein [Candidatus Pacearchaeota archaeon]|nr:HD domain-containing protein [Candidatus Pacearchaeota archaeon]